MAFNPAAAYGANKINTATPAELTLMLYDGAIKFWNIAMVAAEQKDYEKTNLNIKKSKRIIVELKTTLNHKYEIAKDFDLLYDIIFDMMIKANSTKDLEDMEIVLTELRNVRNSWKEVMQKAKDPRL